MLRVALTVERFSPMMSSFSLTSPGKKLTAVAFVCTVLGGLAGCDNQSVLNNNTSASWSSSSQRNPDHIYANHTEGVEPDQSWDSVKTGEDVDRNLAIYRKWGLKQTSDWLAICNQVNVSALRKVGFDPQKDLLNRDGGVGKYSCYWSHNKGQIQFFFSQEKSLDEANHRDGFELRGVVKRDGRSYYMGHIKFVGEGTSLQGFECSLNYEHDGVAYAAAITGKDPKSHDEACNELMSIVTKVE